ncbi:MAG: hypothetical protein KAT58_04085, partial [candidate division Zixibacteria bacterium]|nr:hypothetical protein [candidate division Zixibacteria bacterium]
CVSAQNGWDRALNKWAGARQQALEEAAAIVFPTDSPEPDKAFDEYDDMIADTPERHARMWVERDNWEVAQKIRSLMGAPAQKETDDAQQQ